MSTRPRIWTAAAAAALAAVLLAGCTTSQAVIDPTATPSATPVPSPNPTPTYSPDQATALANATTFENLLARMRHDPRMTGQLTMIKILKPISDAPMIQAALTARNQWNQAGWSETGDQKIVTTKVGDPTTAGTSTSITVTFCKDQTATRVTDKKGAEITDSAVHVPYLLRTYELRKAKGAKAFKVWQAGGQVVSGC
ncbi:hypothetical protein [Propionicimonas sp.]|uniref:hypothetical protein n=1 Tax=Propionicimonas sp. TaxID=1955623 RepID=UPI0017BA9671|nr:hypothetical protein [Propionicimonas sp.]MBA3019656.1 hypothetical protein [Propionicimonas sp.]MBU4207999.1 hypothetical protein [Actinomycetota bacterium]MBU4411463.1 hypothetical protein [Actinomycetota bacterium]MCG2805775.1 hypothetical protein [Propionicimonas sp.]